MFIGPDIGLNGLAVPTCPRRQISAALPGRIAPVKLPLNAPVMRHINRAPTLNNIQSIYRGITQHKLPIAVQAPYFTSRHSIRYENDKGKYVFLHV